MTNNNDTKNKRTSFVHTPKMRFGRAQCFPLSNTAYRKFF